MKYFLRFFGFCVALCIALVFMGCAGQDLDDGLYAVAETDKGKIIFRLEDEKVPMTVASFVGLAEGAIRFHNKEGKRFYDDLTFHRVDAGRAGQGGDPSGTDVGGPGYYTPDELHPDLLHCDEPAGSETSP